MRYVVCKRDQKWLVCAESGLLEFEDFQEAFLVARNGELTQSHLEFVKRMFHARRLKCAIVR
jgi:hypothetical protein